MSENQKKNNILNINFLLSVLTLSAPAAYLIGSFYYQGMLTGYGVNSDTFTISTTDVYVHFYNAAAYFILGVCNKYIVPIINYITCSPGVWYLIGSFVVFVLLLFANFKLRKLNKKIVPKFLVNIFNCVFRYLHWKNNDFTRAIGVSTFATYGFFLILYLFLLFSLLWVILPYQAYLQGVKISEKKVSEFNEKGCFFKESGWSNCSEYYEGEKRLYAGLIIAINNEFVGIFDENGSHILKKKNEYKINRMKIYTTNGSTRAR